MRFQKKIETVGAQWRCIFFITISFVSIKPHMAADVTKRVWEMKDVVERLEAWEA
jgi:hypothetical protein